MMNVFAVLLSLALGAAPPAKPPATEVTLDAKAAYQAVIVDGNTTPSTLLHPDQSFPLASITKLMSALVLYEKGLAWDRTISFEAGDIRGGGIPYFIPGEEISIKDLWNAMLVASSNDATATLIRGSGISEKTFVELMNQQASRLGLAHTHFAEPTGLSPQNVSTARDIAALSRVAFSIPEIRQATEQGTYRIEIANKPPRVLKNTDLFLHGISSAPFTIVAGKTGHIEESGYHFTALSRSGNPNRRNSELFLLGVILDSPSNEARFYAMKKLLGTFKAW